MLNLITLFDDDDDDDEIYLTQITEHIVIFIINKSDFFASE